MRACWSIMLGLLAMGCTDNDPNAQRLMFPPTEDTFHVVSFGVTYLFSDTLRVSARLQAGQVVEVQQFNESGRKELETIHYLSQGVRLEFLDNRGRPQSVITSDSARFNREAGLARLAKGVLLRNDQGEQLETEELFWNQATDSIYTDQRVKITTPDKVIIGREGLRANSAFTAYSLFGIEGEMEALEDP